MSMLTASNLIPQAARQATLMLFGFAIPISTLASSGLPAPADADIQAAAAIFRGTILETQSYQDPVDGHIYTKTIARVDELFKGKAPPQLLLIQRGGMLPDRGELDGTAPSFKVGEQRLLLVSRRPDGTLHALRGNRSALRLPDSADAPIDSQLVAGQALLTQLRAQTAGTLLPGSDLTDQTASSKSFLSEGAVAYSPPLPAPGSTATNLLVGSDGLPARFLLPDRGDPIPYLIDADYLPAGLTLTQAVTAVQTALAAWTNVTSLRYRFAGVQSFGMAAPNVSASDGVLRIQLHDHYNYLGGSSSSGDVLGDGGHAWAINTLSAGWTLGGNVAGNDCHKVVRGFIVLQHANAVMSTLSTFTEVLCHEIGHTIGLGHSSENATESNPILKQAVMYYLVHADGRGASLNSFDTNTVQQLHPRTNTPPYCYDRMLDVVTSSVRPINVPGVNVVQVRGYDLQNNNLTLATTGATANNGTFSVSGSNITYVPNAAFSDSGRFDPAAGSSYDLLYARYSDGLNASPYALVRVLSYNKDSYNEGIPDAWRLSYFGNANPSSGLKHHAADDADGDGYSNLQEYLFGSNPTNKPSNLTITTFAPTTLQWQAKGYEVYELLGSTNLVTWTRAASPLVPTTTVGSATLFTNGGPRQFFRIQKVP
jgi:hypothetical protein